MQLLNLVMICILAGYVIAHAGEHHGEPPPIVDGTCIDLEINPGGPDTAQESRVRFRIPPKFGKDFGFHTKISDSKLKIPFQNLYSYS